MSDPGETNLSVIVPVYRAHPHFTDLLLALARQKTAVRFEVIVVDDHSPDGTFEHVRSFVENLNAPFIRVFSLPKNEGPAIARNRAIEHAGGSAFLLIDADCFVTQDDYIDRVWRAHRGHPGAVIGGGVDGFGLGYAAFCDHFCHWSTNIPGKGPGPVTEAHLVTAQMLIPRAVWEAVGPFESVRTGEDTVFCLKAKQRGVPLRIHGDLVVRHHDRESWRDLLRCFYRFGRDRAATRFLVTGRVPWFLGGPKWFRWVLAPAIAAALTALHVKVWWRHDKRVLLALPGIAAAMIAIASGVAVGRNNIVSELIAKQGAAAPRRRNPAPI